MVDAPMHADEEAVLLEQGSSQANLWGTICILLWTVMLSLSLIL